MQVPGRNVETMLLLNCNPDRIGHGTFLHPDVGGTCGIVDIVSSKRIPIGKLNGIGTLTIATGQKLYYNSTGTTVVGDQPECEFGPFSTKPS